MHKQTLSFALLPSTDGKILCDERLNRRSVFAGGDYFEAASELAFSCLFIPTRILSVP